MRRPRAQLPLLAVAGLTAYGCHQPRPAPASPPRGVAYHRYLQDGSEVAATPALAAGDPMRLHVIDVGQGTAALIELPCGAILVDTGGEQNARFDGVAALTRYLERFFARRRDLRRRLDLLVISHPHLDHTRGIAMVLERFEVGNVIDNGDVRAEPGGAEQIAMHAWLARRRPVGHEDVTAAAIGADGLTSAVIDPIASCPGSPIDPLVRVLWGGPTGPREIGQDPNDESVVVRVDFGRASLLLAGDLERLGIARLLKRFAAAPALLDADVFLVPHHGSRHSTAQALVARVSPEVAIFSAGPHARTLGVAGEFTARAFGHPSKDALLDLGHAGGVSGSRAAPAHVMVGLRGAWQATPSEFEMATVERAIYSTGWDGDVVVAAWPSGRLAVTTGRPPPPVAGSSPAPLPGAPAAGALRSARAAPR